jgi:GTPase
MKLDARVVIVGRMNVGKSSLFNRLSTSVKSLAFDYAGVTRDFIRDTVCWQNSCFELLDTGGVSLKKSADAITEKVRQQALELIKEADIVVFVVDGASGPIADDHDIATLIHKMGKETILVVNKMDVGAAKEQVFVFDRLGFKTVVPVSCQQGTGIGDLLDAIVAAIPHFKGGIEEQKAEFNVALLGKPNVGKSSLLNALLQRERSMVFNEPGTTREAISERISFHQEDIMLTDTPGIRRKRSIDEPLEGLMVKSALHAVKNADVVLLLVDASQGGLSDQELKLAFYVFTELHKALIILFNKSDLTDEEIKDEREMVSSVYKYFLKKIEQLDISCLTGKNVGKIIPLVHKVWQRHSQKFSASELTLICQEALHRKPLYHQSELLKVFRVRQVKAAPISLLMIVNQPTWFGPSQLGYFDTILRRNYDLKSVPLVFMPRTN